MYMLFNDHTFPFSMILVNITIDLMFSCQIIRQNAFRVLSFGPRNKKTTTRRMIEQRTEFIAMPYLQWHLSLAVIIDKGEENRNLFN